MLSLAEATERILNRVSRLPAEAIPLNKALGRVLVDDMQARRALPGWDNSAMDGFAIWSRDVPGTLPIVGVIPAGATNVAPLSPGTCAKIMTGAPVPQGADAVVMREDVVEGPREARFEHSAIAGQHVRRTGEDVSVGATVLTAGTTLGPGEMAMLAAQGITTVRVTCLPTVAILSTGDELVTLGREPKEGQIINSNAISLAAQVQSAGGQAFDAGIVQDDLHSTVRALRSLTDYDVLVTSGGVSVGDFDYVKEAMEQVGVNIDFWKVAIKPGKPLAFGSASNGQLVFGLPGNPVSSMVSFELFVRPAMRKLLGTAKPVRARFPVVLATAYEKKAGRAHYVRARLESTARGMVARPLVHQGSGMHSSMVQVDCLLEIGIDQTYVAEGSVVPALFLR